MINIPSAAFAANEWPVSAVPKCRQTSHYMVKSWAKYVIKQVRASLRSSKRVFSSSMENDQRLTPLPITTDLQHTHIEYTPGYSSMYDDTLAGKRSIRQYFNIVYKRLPIIVAIVIIITAAVSLYSYRQPSIYEARTGIIIEPRKPAAAASIKVNGCTSLRLVETKKSPAPKYSGTLA